MTQHGTATHRNVSGVNEPIDYLSERSYHPKQQVNSQRKWRLWAKWRCRDNLSSAIQPQWSDSGVGNFPKEGVADIGLQSKTQRLYMLADHAPSDSGYDGVIACSFYMIVWYFVPRRWSPNRHPFRRSPPHLIHPSLDRPHSLPQTASGSNQPFCHSTLSGQSHRQTDMG